MADNFTSGYRRDRLTKNGELSRLASPREPNSTLRNWTRTNGSITQNANVTNAASALMRKVARLGRQNYAAGGTGIMGVWSPTLTYDAQNIVFFTPDGGAAGTYYALQAVPKNIAPDTGYPYWAAFPFPPAGVWA